MTPCSSYPNSIRHLCTRLHSQLSFSTSWSPHTSLLQLALSPVCYPRRPRLAVTSAIYCLNHMIFQLKRISWPATCHIDAFVSIPILMFLIAVRDPSLICLGPFYGSRLPVITDKVPLSKILVATTLFCLSSLVMPWHLLQILPWLNYDCQISPT